MTKEINVIIGGFDDGRMPSVQQYDVGSRKFLCRLLERPKVPYQMAEDAFVGVVFKCRKEKPTGEYETKIVDNSTVQVTVPGAVTKIAGAVMMQLVIHQGGGTLHGPEMTFMTLESLKPGDEEPEEPKLLLERLIEKVQKAADRVEQMQIDASGLAGDSNKLGGEPAEAYLKKDATAKNAESLGGEPAEAYLKKDATAKNAESLGGKAPEYYIQPRNLLDNSDFTNPVNQRGQKSYSGASQYTIDRWRTWGAGTLTVNDGYITVSGADFAQYIDAKAMNLTKPHSAFACTTGGEIINLFHQYEDQSGMYVVALPAGYDFLWAVLYEGNYTVETLPPYVPKGYVAELAECQRYYENSWFGGNKNDNLQTLALAWAQNSCEGEFRFLTEKRATPTMTAYGSAGRETVNVYVNGYQPVSDTTWLMRSGRKGAWLRATMDSNMLTIGYTYGLHAHWEASADL